jgi:hypothetical protein
MVGGNNAHGRDERCIHNFGRKLEVKRQFGMPKCKRENEDWINLAQNR